MADPPGDRELERYARQIVLPDVGGIGQRAFASARIAIIGAGGIGSAVIPALAGAGIGSLTIVDDGRVELSNLHRQTLFAERDIGAAKASRAADAVRTLNAGCTVRAVGERIGTDNAAALCAGHDMVVDGSDNFATRLAVSDACVALGTPLVSAAAVMFQAQVGLFTARPCYRCWVGDAFDSEDCDTCAEQGVLGPMPHLAGQLAALIVLEHLAGMAPGAGRIHLFDGRKLAWRQIAVPVDPACSACAS